MTTSEALRKIVDKPWLFAWQSWLNQAVCELESLKKENESLKRDKERLDKLELHFQRGREVSCYQSVEGWKLKLANKYNYEVAYANDLRSAIDAAMNGGEVK